MKTPTRSASLDGWPPITGKAATAPTRPRCANCGTPNTADARFCSNCGASASGQQYAVGQRSRIVAAVLAIFLGGLGLHKFYNGRIVQGIVYLLFCWTFIPAIVGFIEGVWYLTMSDAAFWARFPA